MSKVQHAIHDEDAELVIAWRRGELSSFETLVGKYRKRMLNIAFGISGDYEDACDVVQESFVAAYRGIDAFRGAARFSTWLTSITVDLSRNRLRQTWSKRQTEVYSLVGSPIDPSALEQLERNGLNEKLRECISGLAADLREAIVLRDVQEFSYEEIATILKVREGTVKSRLFEAREIVKDCLKNALGEL